MADPVSRQECIRRHKAYPFDVWGQRNSLQVARLEQIGAMIPVGCKVLDIGCNSGYIAHLTKGCECYGVDVSPELVKKANRLITAQLAPAEKLPFEDKFFDVSVLGEILEHVYDPAKALCEAVRVTKRLIVGSTPHEKGDWGLSGQHKVSEHKFHVRVFTREALKELLDPYGTVSISELRDRHGRVQMWIFEVVLG